MNTKAIILDKDGVLLDFNAFWLPVSIEASRKILAQLGYESISLEEVLSAIGVENGTRSIQGALSGGTYGDIAEKMRQVMTTHGIAVSPEALTKHTVEAYHSCIGEGVILPHCDDIVSVLEDLKSRGLVIALVTSDDTTMTRHSLRTLGIEAYFDIVYADDGTHPNKPDPYCINDLIEKLGIEKSQIVMVGDSISDMIFAKNGGIRGIGVAETASNRDILLTYTDTVIPDISHLWKVLY